MADKLREDKVIDNFSSCLVEQLKVAGIPKCKMSKMIERRESYVSDITGARSQQYMRTLPLWMVKKMAGILTGRGADGDLLLRHAYTYLSLKKAA